jgi:hypothetical protein
MSRLLKSDLKLIVKECLLEILAEGLAESTTKRKQVMKQKNSKKEKLRESIISRRSLGHMSEGVSRGNNVTESSRSYLDSISYGSDQNTEEHTTRNNQILERVSKVTSDPILSEMLADTAQTTLPAQMSADHARGPSNTSTPPADRAASIVQSSTPEDLFGGEASSKWATLAFGS